MSPLKILVVDDDFSNAYVTGQLFEILGHDVQIVESGRAALECVNLKHPDLIMVDISMPDINGYELCEILRNIPGCKTARIIAQSGRGQDSDFGKAQKAGFDDYLLKPVALDTIRSVLTSVETGHAIPLSIRSSVPMRRA